MKLCRSRALVGLVVAGVMGAGLSVPAVPASAAAKPPPRHIKYVGWTTHAELDRGVHRGTKAVGGALRIQRPVGTRLYRDPYGGGKARRYELARWLSPRAKTPFGFDELIPSWNARTPGRSWIQVDVRATTGNGQRSKWYVMGRWSAGDHAFHRTSAPAQADRLGRVAVDTFKAVNSRRFRDWQLRVTLLRPVGGGAVPRLRSAGAVASRLPTDRVNGASPVGLARGQVLPVPAYSQQRHVGRYPQWGGGGEAWCSPTSTSMVLRYWKSGPTPTAYSWVQPQRDPWVVHAARAVFDHRYDGAGNWSFNAAYAGMYMNAFVTRLRSLNEAERFIKAGIPLVVSTSFDKRDLDGAGYSTNGHLMVIRGFDRRGNVIANDPASHLRPRNDQVRVKYQREQFENAWLPHSGGLAYVIHPPSVTLPTSPRQPNW